MIVNTQRIGAAVAMAGALVLVGSMPERATVAAIPGRNRRRHVSSHRSRR